MLLVELPPAAAVLLLSGEAKVPKLQLPTNGAGRAYNQCIELAPKEGGQQ